MPGIGSKTWRTLRRAALGVAGLLAVSALVGVPTAGPGTTGRAAASTPGATDGSYAIIDATGGVLTFGGAGYSGDTLEVPLNDPIVGGAADPSGGYWLVASDGGVFTFGNAKFFGSTGGIALNRPIVGMAATPDGNGYWLVASDGGIFSYGDAAFYGSTGGIAPEQADRGHGRHAGRERVLARRLRRRDLLLRRRPILRARRGASRSNKPDRGHGRHPGRERLLAGRLRRRDLLVR